MKTRIITTAVLMMLTVSLSFATGDKEKNKGRSTETKASFSLTGTIVDHETGEALAGVLIKVEETGVSAYSDFEGNFQMAFVPGAYTLTTTLISYEVTTVKLDTNNSSGNLEVKLSSVSKTR
jgi:hypothetical protein